MVLLKSGLSPTLYGCTRSIFSLLFVSEFLIFYIFSGSYKSPVYYWKPLSPSPEDGAAANGYSLSLAQNSQPFWGFFWGDFLFTGPCFCSCALNQEWMGKFEFGPWSTGDTYAAGKVLPVAHGWDFYWSPKNSQQELHASGALWYVHLPPFWSLFPQS